MPEDLEVLWVEAVVFVQPVTERAADWLQSWLPAKRGKWSMRTVGHDEIEGLAVQARRQKLTIGGIHLPPIEGEENL